MSSSGIRILVLAGADSKTTSGCKNGNRGAANGTKARNGSSLGNGFGSKNGAGLINGHALWEGSNLHVVTKHAIHFQRNDATTSTSGIPDIVREDNADAENKCDVIILDATHIPHAAAREILRQLRESDVGILVSLPELTTEAFGLVADGADLLLKTGAEQSQLIAAILAVHHACQQRRKLRQRVRVLEKELSRERAINRAKSIIAQTHRVTENDALRHLRNEARNRRRPIHDLAMSIVEAHEVLHAVPHVDEPHVTADRPSADEPLPAANVVDIDTVPLA